jgi:single-strand DNA-binding protein
MANLNKVMLIGRLTRDPEVRAFANGGKVAKFGFAVNNRRKNQQTGEWEDEPVFIDVEAFNRGDFGKLADRVEQGLRKGQQVFLEGHLRLDQWTSQEGQKRSKLLVVLDNLQYLEPRADGAGMGGGGVPRASAPRQLSSPPPSGSTYEEPEAVEQSEPPNQESDIPF